MQATPDKTDTSSDTLSISWGWFLLAVSPLLVRLLHSLFETNWWGVNSLAFMSGQYGLRVAVLTLFLFGMLVFERVRKRDILGKLYKQSPTLTGGKTSILLALSLGALAFLLGQDSYLFGNGYALVGELAQSNELFVHPMTYLATKTIALAYLPFENVDERALNNSATAISALAATCAALTIWVWLRICKLLARNKSESFFLFSMALFSGTSILFFGNGEIYSPAVVIVSLIVLCFVTMIKAATKPIRLLSAALLVLLSILAPFYLAQLIFILPATVFMLGLVLAPGPKRERIWGILALLTLVAIITTLYWQAQSDLWIKARIVGLSGKPPEFDYSLFSLRRLADVLNTSFVLWPLFPLTLGICLRYIWRERCDHIVGGLSMLALSFTAWIIISDFPGGSAREITSVALFALPATFLAAYLWIKRYGETSWFGRTTVTIGAVAALSFLALSPVYLNGDAGVDYLDHDYKQRKDRYLSGLVDFRDHYYFQQDFTEADQWEWSFSRRSPSFLDHRSIKLMFNQGDYAATLDRLALLMSTNPYWSTLYSTKAAALQSFGRFDVALQTIDQGLQLSPGDVPMLTVRGNILGALKKQDSAKAMYLQALKYDSHSIITRKDLGLHYIETGQPVAAQREAYLIFEDDAGNPYSFLIVGLVAFDRQDYDRAQRYLTYALARGKQLPEAEIARFVLNRIEQISTN